MAELITQWCSECRTADTAPRHQILTADGTLETRHMDCCRDAGTCIDQSCHVILDHAGDKRNDDLRAHIVTHGNDLHELVQARRLELEAAANGN